MYYPLVLTRCVKEDEVEKRRCTRKKQRRKKLRWKILDLDFINIQVI